MKLTEEVPWIIRVVEDTVHADVRVEAQIRTIKVDEHFHTLNNHGLEIKKISPRGYGVDFYCDAR